MSKSSLPVFRLAGTGPPPALSSPRALKASQGISTARKRTISPVMTKGRLVMAWGRPRRRRRILSACCAAFAPVRAHSPQSALLAAGTGAADLASVPGQVHVEFVRVLRAGDREHL